MDPLAPEPTNDALPRPKRRVRYPGKNPRQFEQKYKEHRPNLYPETIEKVVASGKTPAGSHRPVLVEEVLGVLDIQPGQILVDCTLGFGSHAREFLQRLGPGGRLIGLDVDPMEQPRTIARLREAGFGEDVFTPVHRNFAGISQVLQEHELERVDSIFADLGVSSMQLDDPQRGFTFKADGPLDLRLNPQRPPSAAQLLATLTAEKLAELLEENADEPNARVLAEGLMISQLRRPIERTQSLADEIRRILVENRLSVDRETDNGCIRRVFQALRIAVNDEFGTLDALLRSLPWCLKAGGTACILTFHSGEDRRVKKAFQSGLREGIYSKVSEEVIRPSAKELHANPRSAPAKLRWAIRAGTE